jgi:electron-transferring-flavoprotein dehydrogenase
MQSGMYAAQAIFAALKNDDTSSTRLSAYDELLNDSYAIHDLYRTRNMRLAFKSGFYSGAAKAGLMALTGGRFPGRRIDVEEDAKAPRTTTECEEFTSDGELTFSKVDAVFKSGNVTRDTIQSHLIPGENVGAELARFYTHMCPAAVYEEVDGELCVNAPNCVDCKATDVVGPRWTPREGGSGPAYKRM